MAKHSSNWIISGLRITFLALHIFYGILLAIIYPYLNQSRQCHIQKLWSRQLLAIFNIGIQIEGQQPARREDGCLIVANHVSWLDIFVLNAIHPSRFIAKSEVRDWPIIGWLCKRTGTIFIDRGLRQNTSLINTRVSYLLGQGVYVALFPEGTTTDGKQVGHFHSALIQSAINVHAKLCPIALRYQGDDGELSTAAAFTGDTTLIQSIWKILRGGHLNALVVHTPTLMPAVENRRALARAAQDAIVQALQHIGTTQQEATHYGASASPNAMFSPSSTYALLLNPNLADD